MDRTRGQAEKTAAKPDRGASVPGGTRGLSFTKFLQDAAILFDSFSTISKFNTADFQLFHILPPPSSAHGHSFD